jgi:hypothetical protein
MSGRELLPLVPPPDGFRRRVEIYARIEDSRWTRPVVPALPLHRNAFLERRLRFPG